MTDRTARLIRFTIGAVFFGAFGLAAALSAVGLYRCILAVAANS